MKKLFLTFFLFQVSLFSNVGTFTAVKGKVEIISLNGIILATTGATVSNKDKISTGKNAKAQIKFTDGTVFTLGKNTSFNIDEFSMEPSKEKAEFSMTKGLFKTITGTISKINPNQFKLKTKSASIGIRGTIFLGEIKSKYEKIACTQGAISVTSSDQTVNVDAGEMTTVFMGQPPTPPAPIDLKFLKHSTQTDSQNIKIATDKISNLSIKSGFKISNSDIQDIVDTITQVNDADSRRNLEDLLNDTLYASFQQKLSDTYYKVTPPYSYDTGYNKLSNYLGIDWGFYTVDPVQWNITENFEEKLSSATPVQMWMEMPDGSSLASVYTNESTIQEKFIGYDDTAEYYAPHWDGTNQSRIIGEYSGKVLAVNDYETILDPSTGKPIGDSYFTATSANGKNNTYLKVDYGNKNFNGYLNYDIADGKNGGSDAYFVYFAGMGEAHVSPTGLKETIYANKTGYIDFNSAEFTFRYLGENTEQIAGTFNINRSDGMSYGNMVFNQTSLITLRPELYKSNNNFSWGYWASSQLGDATDIAILNVDPYGGWVKPNSGLSPTDSSQIASLINDSISANYTGSIIGTVHDNILNTTELMKNGAINLDFNFGAQSYSGDLNFNTDSNIWNMTISNGLIKNEGFQSGGTSTFNSQGNHNAGTLIYGEMNGKFYGNNAENIAGGFEVLSSKNKTAIGAFYSK